MEILKWIFKTPEAIYALNYAHLFTLAREGENLMAADVKLSKRDFVRPRMREFNNRWF